MARIEYEDKVKVRNSNLPAKNTVRDVDLNEIKESVNALYDDALIFKWTIDGTDIQTGNIYPNTSCKIESVTNLVNTPTTTITKNGNPYTLGTDIASGDTIGITLSVAGVIDLNFIINE